MTVSTSHTILRLTDHPAVVQTRQELQREELQLATLTEALERADARHQTLLRSSDPDDVDELDNAAREAERARRTVALQQNAVHAARRNVATAESSAKAEIAAAHKERYAEAVKDLVQATQDVISRASRLQDLRNDYRRDMDDTNPYALTPHIPQALVGQLRYWLRAIGRD